MGSQAELAIKADAKGIRAVGRALKETLGIGQSESKKMQHEIERVDHSMSSLAKTQRSLILEMRKVSVGTDAYKALAGQLEKAGTAMKTFQRESSSMKQAQAGASGGGGHGGMMQQLHHLNEKMQAERMMRMAEAGISMGEKSPLQPFAAQGHFASLLAGAAATLPVVGAPLAGWAAMAAAGNSIRQERMDKYLAYGGAWAQNSPHMLGASPDFGNDYGMGPAQAMGIAAGFGRASSGQVLWGHHALDLSTRGYSAQVGGVGNLLAPGGGSGALFGDQQRQMFVKNALGIANRVTTAEASAYGGSANPMRIENLLQAIAQHTSTLAARGIDGTVGAAAGLRMDWMRANQSIGGRAGLSRQLFAGARGDALSGKLDAAVAGDGMGGALGLLAAGFGQPGGPSLAEAMMMGEAGVGHDKGQIAPGAMVGTIQRMFGRGGDKADMMDIMLGKQLGLSSREAAGLRRSGVDDFSGAIPGRMTDHGRKMARPAWIDKVERDEIREGQEDANSGEAEGAAHRQHALNGILVGVAKDFNKGVEKFGSIIKLLGIDLHEKHGGVPSKHGGH